MLSWGETVMMSRTQAPNHKVMSSGDEGVMAESGGGRWMPEAKL